MGFHVAVSKYRFISDPGHGWLEVPRADVIRAGVTPSQYSYQSRDGSMIYLEEDCDATAFLDALKAIGSIAEYRDAYVESYEENTLIRHLPSAKGF